jgi:hypothetical protein
MVRPSLIDEGYLKVDHAIPLAAGRHRTLISDNDAFCRSFPRASDIDDIFIINFSQSFDSVLKRH